MQDDTRLEAALYLLDMADAEDPRAAATPNAAPNEAPNAGPGATRTAAMHRATARWVELLAPNASEELRVAARCHWMRGWLIPRAAYAPGLEGFREWRAYMRLHHAGEAAGLLRGIGYTKDEIDRVKELLQRTYLGADPEAQALEDAAALAFAQTDLVALTRHGATPAVREELAEILARLSDAAKAQLPELIAALPLPTAELLREVTGAPRGGV